VFDDTVKINDLPLTPAGDSAVYFTYDAKARPRRIVPIGGNTLFVANVDYRVRSLLLPELLQFTFFTDVGTVWNRNTQANIGFSPYWTPGIGLRVFSPLGPIQINAGYNPYPPVFGQALYTPGRDRAQKGFTGVYCAVPESAPLTAQTPTAVKQIDPNTGAVTWQPDKNATCERTFQQPSPRGFWHRLTFTFSIGPDF
jgi:hypothetical protein